MSADPEAALESAIMAPLPPRPQHTALVNIDLQNFFVNNAQDGVALVRRINEFATACRDLGVLVIHTAHVLRPDGSNAGILAEMIEPIREGVLNRGAESAALHRDVVVDARDVVVEKPRFGAFHGTDLELILRSHAIDTIVITGISTDVCCDTTAREANARDFRVLFASDGTAVAGDNAVAAQEATLAIVGEMFAEVAPMAEILARLSANG
jgi:nicotinamidase-related amidase